MWILTIGAWFKNVNFNRWDVIKKMWIIIVDGFNKFDEF